MRLKLAIAYLESFAGCDADKDHYCSSCGARSANQVDHSEVKKALVLLKTEEAKDMSVPWGKK